MTRRLEAPDRPVPLRLVPAAAAEPADPRVRPERVARARERIRRRYYERADVTSALVEALLVEIDAPN